MGLEGGKRALAAGKALALALGAKPLYLKAEHKPFYHASCSLVSNYLVVLIDSAVTLLMASGMGRKKALGLLRPLLEGTLRNVKSLDTDASLTGPIQRGDVATIRAHLRALRRFPGIKSAYVELARLALEIAERKGLPSSKIRELKRLVGGR